MLSSAPNFYPRRQYQFIVKFNKQILLQMKEARTVLLPYNVPETGRKSICHINALVTDIKNSFKNQEDLIKEQCCNPNRHTMSQNSIITQLLYFKSLFLILFSR